MGGSTTLSADTVSALTSGYHLAWGISLGLAIAGIILAVVLLRPDTAPQEEGAGRGREAIGGQGVEPGVQAGHGGGAIQDVPGPPEHLVKQRLPGKAFHQQKRPPEQATRGFQVSRLSNGEAQPPQVILDGEVVPGAAAVPLLS